jgi:hypothetical protein
MDPVTLTCAAIIGAAWLKARGTPSGSAGTAPQTGNRTPQNDTPIRMRDAQTPPVDSTNLVGRTGSFVQRPLYPAGIWNPTAPMTQGSGSDVADSGETFNPAQRTAVCGTGDFGMVNQWSGQMNTPTPLAPVTLTPQPAPVDRVTIQIGEPAIPPKLQALGASTAEP